MSRSRSLTGDPLTDALVPLVQELADAVYRGDDVAIAMVRADAEDVLLVHDHSPDDAGWAMAVVAAAMLPGPAPPAVLLAWLQTGTPAPPIDAPPIAAASPRGR